MKRYAIQILIVCLKGGVAVPSDKADFKTKIITRGKEGHFIMKNQPFHEKNTIYKCAHNG